MNVTLTPTVDAGGIQSFQIVPMSTICPRPAGLPPPIGEIKICKAFLARCTPLKRLGLNSYWLKHRIENWQGEYVCNGACIQAALNLGLIVTPNRDGINARIAVSIRSVRVLIAERKRWATA